MIRLPKKLNMLLPWGDSRTKTRRRPVSGGPNALVLLSAEGCWLAVLPCKGPQTQTEIHCERVKQLKMSRGGGG